MDRALSKHVWKSLWRRLKGTIVFALLVVPLFGVIQFESFTGMNSFGDVPSMATRCCAEPSSELKALISFLDEQARGSGGIARHLASHPGFQTFAASQTPTEELIARYFEASFSRLADPDLLRARQSEALRMALWHHGYTTLPESDGFRSLEKVSLGNRERLFNLPRRTVSTEIAAEIEAAVSAIRPVFIHNTNLLQRIPEIPLVSSKEIRRTAGVGGLNTFFFNRGFLHSDDNLFFFLDLATASPVLPLMQSIYGKYQFVPDDAFARERGWVSAFIMYPYDLLRFAAYACPGDVPAMIDLLRAEYAAELGTASWTIAEINKRLRDVRRDAPRSVRVLRQGFPLWNRARKELYRLDFTVQDFTEVVREAFARWLAELASSDQVTYQQTLDIIRTKGPAGIQLDAFKAAYGLDLYFEFKIPVALPPGRMRQLGGDN